MSAVGSNATEALHSLVASGQQVAGAIWPPLFGIGVERLGWRPTLLWFGVFTTGVIVPIAWMLRVPAPETVLGRSEAAQSSYLEGMPAMVAMALLCAAIVGCCIAMAYIASGGLLWRSRL
jgi:hypothetical protein